MKLDQLASAHGDFYVPSFAVKVGRVDVVRDLFLAVTKVEVDLKANAAGRFSFAVASAFDWKERQFLAHRGRQQVDLLDLFAFGSSVDIELGYADGGEPKPMLKGIVTEIGTGFAEGGTPELTVSGYDGLYPLSIGKTSRSWEKVPDSTAVRDVARGLGQLKVQETRPEKERIDQNEENDLAFIEKLAKRNGAVFYMEGEELYFGPRRNKLRETVELAWGEGLSSFSPTINLANQVAEVVVVGWSAEKGEAVEGRAGSGDESSRDPDRLSGAERVRKAVGGKPAMRIRAAVHTEAEAEARARAILEERAQALLTGDGECVGVPGILPDTNIALSGLGRAFSKIYYVNSAVHSLDSGGYRTRFQVEEARV